MMFSWFFNKMENNDFESIFYNTTVITHFVSIFKKLSGIHLE